MRTHARLILAVGSGVVAGLMVAAGDSTDDPIKKELKKFDGTWTLVSREVNGKDALGEDYKRFKIIYDAAGHVVVEKAGETVAQATVKLDPTQKPPTIDIIYTEGHLKGKTFRGIYRIEEDTYTICLSMGGRERPREFASKPDRNTVLETLKREKP